MRIRRAVKWSPDGTRVVGSTKTKRSNRTVVVPRELHAELDQLVEGRARTDLIFTAARGGWIFHRTFWERVWLPAVRHLEPRPRIHDLRHSHASILLAGGVPIHVVQARLGHESIQTTVDTYTHLMPDAQVAAAAAAGNAFLAPAPRAAELEQPPADRADLLRQGAAAERARIVWWLRANVDGPAAANATPDYLEACRDLARVIEQHPDRFAQAPSGLTAALPTT